MYKINLNEPWASITYEFGLMITPFYIHKKPHQFNIINVSIIAHPYPSSLQINSNWNSSSMESQDIICWCQGNNYFLLKLSHFCYQFSRHSQLFLAHNFQHYLKVLGVSAKEHPISTDISSREHTYLNNDFLNKKHIDGK